MEMKFKMLVFQAAESHPVDTNTRHWGGNEHFRELLSVSSCFSLLGLQERTQGWIMEEEKRLI